MAHEFRKTTIPNPPRITMRDAVTGERAVLFAQPGYIPTPEDVQAVIDARGQWGDAPKSVPCPSCGFFLFTNDEHCPACNSPRSL